MMEMLLLTHVNHFGCARCYERLATQSGVVRMESNRTYFMRRAAQERSAATHASGETARKAHLELAERYRQRVDDDDPQTIRSDSAP